MNFFRNFFGLLLLLLCRERVDDRLPGSLKLHLQLTPSALGDAGNTRLEHLDCRNVGCISFAHELLRGTPGFQEGLQIRRLRGEAAVHVGGLANLVYRALGGVAVPRAQTSVAKCSTPNGPVWMTFSDAFVSKHKWGHRLNIM